MGSKCDDKISKYTNIKVYEYDSEAPECPCFGKFQEQDQIYVILEKDNLKLPKTLKVNVVGAGTYTTHGDDDIKSGSTVDIFMFHFDAPNRKELGRPVVEFSVTFKKSILGLITSDLYLAVCEKMLDIPIPNADERGIFDGGDEITISKDKRTISGKLSIGDSPKIDQFRVIVAG